MMSFDDALTRANFGFVYFLQSSFLTFFNEGGGLNPQTPLWLRHWRLRPLNGLPYFYYKYLC